MAKRKRDDDLRMADSPGKFEGELLVTAFLHMATGDGGADEEASIEHGGGWYGLLRGYRREDRLAKSAERIAKEEGTTLTPGERAFLNAQAGVILWERSDGFVIPEYFENKDELEAAWRKTEEFVAEHNPPDED